MLLSHDMSHLIVNYALLISLIILYQGHGQVLRESILCYFTLCLKFSHEYLRKATGTTNCECVNHTFSTICFGFVLLRFFRHILLTYLSKTTNTVVVGCQ